MMERLSGSFCNYTDLEKSVLNDLLTKHEYGYIEELKFCVRGRVLAPFQTRLLAYALINKRCILSADTGLGKTGLACGLINCVNQKQPSMKWVLICPAFNMWQTYEELSESLYTAKVTCSDNRKGSRMFLTSLSLRDWDVAVLSYEALANMEVQQYLLDNREFIQGLIIDESQLVCNLNGTTSVLLESMSLQMEYMIMLTATPIRVNVGQFIKQIHMLDRGIFGKEVGNAINYYTKYDDEFKPVGVQHLPRLLDEISGRYISVTRNEIGLKGDYQVNPILCTPGKDYTEVDRKDVPRLVKGDYDGCAMRALYEEVNRLNSKGLKGLIYINLNENKDKVKQYLHERGIETDIFDGQHTKTKSQKEKVKQRFIDGEVNCLITNLTVGVNLQCDYIIFYELTFDFKQMLGRGERGLKSNDLYLSFIVVDNSDDVIIFYENVYNRAKLLGQVCGKDIAEIEEAYKIIKGKKYELKKLKYQLKEEEEIAQLRRAEEEKERRLKSLNMETTEIISSKSEEKVPHSRDISDLDQNDWGDLLGALMK